MKSRIVVAMVVVVAAGFATYAAWGQSNAPPSPAAHKVGLIDMAHIFKNYQRFEAVREEIKREIATNEEKARQMVVGINALNAELQRLKQGTTEFAAKEKQLLAANTDLEAFRRNIQRELIARESDQYKQIYLEVQEAVQKYAYHYNYALIMKFSRDELVEADEPQEVLNRMNRQVVYHRDEDDITIPILDYLHRQLAKTAPKPTANEATRPAPAVRPTAK